MFNTNQLVLIMKEQKELRVETKKLGYIFRKLRVEKKLSQESIAHDVGVAVSTIERIENGKVSPRFDSIEKIFNHLNFEIFIKQK